MFANNLSSIYAYKHTYLQATKKRDIKKERKIVFKHTDLQTSTQFLCKRETEAQ